MKISKLFHTLYATVMALPVLIIPIFALNILHKENEPISIEVQEKISVDFNQMFNRVSNIQTLNYNQNGITATYDATQERILINGTASADVTIPVYFEPNYIQQGNIYLTKNLKSNGLGIFGVYGLDEQLRNTASSNNAYLTITIQNGTNLNNFYYDGYCINLTKMFGSGNEPSISVFNQYFPYVSTDYIENQKLLVNKPSPTTYNDTDIGSQFVYALYKPVNDYFNVTEFFGLASLSDWFLLNVFSGNVNTLVFTIIFNLIIYWLAVSLFWLIFDVLMYVPSMVHKMLDKARME